MSKKDKSDIAYGILLPIGSIAAALKVNQRTLRIYDEENILVPKRDSKNRRYYTMDDLEKGRLIVFLTRNLALNLSGVKIVLTMVEEQKIKPYDYLKYISNIALKAGITEKIQSQNKTNKSKSGRPSNKKIKSKD